MSETPDAPRDEPAPDAEHPQADAAPVTPTPDAPSPDAPSPDTPASAEGAAVTPVAPAAGAAPAPPAAPASGPIWVREAVPLGALVAGMALLMAWLGGAFVPKIPPGPPVASVGVAAEAVAEVRAAQFPERLAQVGTVRSRYRAAVASKLLAQVTKLEVEAGDSVAAGTVVAILDSQDLRAQLARVEAQVRAAERGVEVREAQVSAANAARDAAQAQVDRGRADYTRYEALVTRGVATAEQLDQVRAARDVAIAELGAALGSAQAALQTLAQAREELVVAGRAQEEVKVLLGYTTLRAPFAGRVTERLVEVGETVAPGQGVVRIEDPELLELHADVAESLAARLQLGQELAVEIDALGATLNGKIRELSPEVDPASRTLQVKLTLPATAGLRAGLFGRLQIPVGTRHVLLVPAAALERVGQLDLVRVVGEDGIGRRRFVTLGRPRGDDVEVASGLAAGERVALP